MPFTVEDLRLIRAMCMSANPQFPASDMYPAWVSVYETAGKMLDDLDPYASCRLGTCDCFE